MRRLCLQKFEKQQKSVVADLLPSKSGDKYNRTYDLFMKWKIDENVPVEDFSEDVLIAYFSELSARYKPSSMWSFYSMIKSTVQSNHKLDVDYPRMNSFLKKLGVGFVPKQSHVFKPEGIVRFLVEAPDNKFLDMKVILVFGIYGATRADELSNLQVKDVAMQGDVFIIKILKTKTSLILSKLREKWTISSPSVSNQKHIDSCLTIGCHVIKCSTTSTISSNAMDIEPQDITKIATVAPVNFDIAFQDSWKLYQHEVQTEISVNT